jgi:glycosyltransferase involved in cell wall biosynthesis
VIARAVPDQPLKVCLVAPLPPPYGGIANWSRMLLQYARRRADIRIHAVDTAPRWRAVHDTAAWKRVLGGSVQALRDLVKVSWTLLRHQPDVTHLTTSGQLAVLRDVAVILTSRAFGRPVVYHLRFGRVPQIAEARTLEWRLLRRSLRLANVVVPIDAATETAVRRYVPDARVMRIPNCIDPAELPASTANPGGSRTVMYLGWVIPSKGTGVLVEAWARIRSDGWRLLVVGPGADSYKQELAARYPAPNVEFAGEMAHDAAMRVMADADVVVLPSFSEGFPNVVLEAMTLGKAIVASSVGAIPEMLADECGVLVQPGDVEDLAHGLSRVLSDDERRAVVGHRARERALARYSIEAVFAQYRAIWEAQAEHSARVAT